MATRNKTKSPADGAVKETAKEIEAAQKASDEKAAKDPIREHQVAKVAELGKPPDNTVHPSERPLAPLQAGHLGVDVLLPLGEPGLPAPGLFPARPDVLFGLPAHPGDLVLDLDQGLADRLLGLVLGLGDQPLGPGDSAEATSRVAIILRMPKPTATPRTSAPRASAISIDASRRQRARSAHPGTRNVNDEPGAGLRPPAPPDRPFAEFVQHVVVVRSVSRPEGFR